MLSVMLEFLRQSQMLFRERTFEAFFFEPMSEDAEAEDTCAVSHGVGARELYDLVTQCHQDSDALRRLQSVVPSARDDHPFTWRDSLGNTALHALLKLPDAPATRECLDMMLVNEACRDHALESRNSCYQTPLAVAVLWNNVSGVRSLLDAGASPKVVYYETVFEALDERNLRCLLTDGLLPGPEYAREQVGARIRISTVCDDGDTVRFSTRVQRDEAIVRMLKERMHDI